MTMRLCENCGAYTPVEDGRCAVCGIRNNGMDLRLQAVKDGRARKRESYRVKAKGKDITLHDERWDDEVYFMRIDQVRETPMGQTIAGDPWYAVTDWKGMSSIVDGPVEDDCLVGIVEKTTIENPPYGVRVRYTAVPDRIVNLGCKHGWGLGPCPGCGGMTGHVSRYDGGGYSVWCEECGYETDTDYRKADHAVDEWNSGGF